MRNSLDAAGFYEAAAKSMTLATAEALLRAPKFGDANCITATYRIKLEPEVQRLRQELVGKHSICECCGGDGEGTTTGSNCPVCNGNGYIVITPQWAATWEMDVIEDVMEEIERREMRRRR